MANALARATRRTALEAASLRAMARSKMLHLDRPGTLLAGARAMRDAGIVAASPVLAAERYGDAPGLHDERGTLSFAEVAARVERLANHWTAQGITAGDHVAILARNHRGLLDATYAGIRVGAKVLFLNTDFAGPQARDVCAREGVDVLVYDEEFADVLAEVDAPKGRYLAWTDDPAASTLEQAVASGADGRPPRPAKHGSLVLLTSGTTGTPKGANREQPRSLSLIGGILDRVPYRPGEPLLVAPPLFHGLGLATAIVNYAMGNALVLQRRFAPREAVQLLAEHRCGAATVVPIMLNRILALGPDELARHDLSALRIVLSSGSRLEADLCERARRVLGDVVYNLYGSTEVSVVTVATPDDLRAVPGTVGRAVLGVDLAVIDEADRPVPPGVTGRIVAGSVNAFDGYTGGGNKDVVDGRMATGDLGHLDEVGRLVVEGRDDDMIISGGENVFPGEIEELLTEHPAIDQAVVVGLADEEFGQRLAATVVPVTGAGISPDEVREHVRSHLARFKVPREVLVLDELPRNPTGKVLRREVVAQLTGDRPGGTG